MAAHETITEVQLVLLERGAHFAKKRGGAPGKIQNYHVLAQDQGESLDRFFSRIEERTHRLLREGARFARVVWVMSSANELSSAVRRRVAELFENRADGSIPPEMVIESSSRISPESRAELFGLVETLTRRTPSRSVRLVFSDLHSGVAERQQRRESYGSAP